MKILGRILIALVLLSIPAAAQAQSVGTVTGKVRFFQNQGNFCPSSRNCTGARYPQSQWHTFQPVKRTVVTIHRSDGGQIGAGSTNDSGDFTIQWISSVVPQQGMLRWYAEHADGRFRVKTGTGARQVFSSSLKLLPVGQTMNWGNLDWGSSTTPHPVANVYDGAYKTMTNSIQQSSLVWSNFTNIEIRAFSSSCPTSCAGGKTVILDTGASTPFAYSARIAHELGHIVSGLASKGLNSNSCNDYSRNGGGWFQQGGEWMCATLEEAFATHVGDAGRYAPSASQAADTCGVEIGACTMMLEPSGGTCAGFEEGRWPLTTERILWDIYDTGTDGGQESTTEPLSRIIGNMNNFAVGTANNQRDEPFQTSGTCTSGVCDKDGKSEFDYLVNYQNAYGVPLSGPDSINCAPPGD